MKSVWRKLAFGLVAAMVLSASRAAPSIAQETAAAEGAAVEEPAAEPEKNWSIELGLDYSTLYMFRGINLLGEDQEVWTPRVVATFGNWSFWSYGYLGNFDAFDDAGDPAGEGNYQEFDFAGDYTFSIGETFSLTVGAVAYLYDSETEIGTGFADTWELYAIGSWDVFLAPTFIYAYDVDAIDGAFLTMTLSHDFELSEKVGLTLLGELGVDFGYNQPGDPEAGIDESSGDLNHWMVSADLPIQFTDAFSGHVMAQQFFSLDVADELEQDDETVFTAGIAYTF